MRQLLLLRHAKSSWDDPALSDHARPLNARGRRAAAAMARAMAAMDLAAPDAILVSSARRTLQTLEALRPHLDGSPAVVPMDALYLAPWSGLLDALRTVPATARRVLMIGHNPGLHDLAMALVGPAAMASSGAPGADEALRRLAEGYPTGTLAEFSVAVPWSALSGGGGRLVRFLAPADLPEMAA